MSRVFDCIIVGQGLAGAVLSSELAQVGQQVYIIDAAAPDAASMQAAGIINPVTGWRYVKSWKIDALLPVAAATYTRLAALIGQTIWQPRPLIRTIKNLEEENQWLLRQGAEGYEAYISKELTPSVSALKKGTVHPVRAFATVDAAAQVNVPALVAGMRQYWKKNNLYRSENFDFSALTVDTEGVVYKDIKAKRIVFCEGAAGATNPFFQHLPFRPDKGELLLVKIEGLGLNAIFKHKFTLVPLADTPDGTPDLYWYGATDAWVFETAAPTPDVRRQLTQALEDTLTLPFEVVAHQAAIRPTVKDRRPFIGWADAAQKIGIFNGFGTKGASLVPFWAQHFVQHLEQQTPLDAAVDIARFE